MHSEMGVRSQQFWKTPLPPPIKIAIYCGIFLWRKKIKKIKHLFLEDNSKMKENEAWISNRKDTIY